MQGGVARPDPPPIYIYRIQLPEILAMHTYSRILSPNLNIHCIQLLEVLTTHVYFRILPRCNDIW